MNLAKNECIKFINRIKKSIDRSPDRIKYARKELEHTVEYIEKLRREHPEYSMEEFNKILCYKTKEAISTMSTPTRSDMYLQKTLEKALKDIDLIYYEIETVDRERFVGSKRRAHKYTSNMENNIKVITQDLLEILLDENPIAFRKKFVNNSLTEEEKNKVKEKIKQFVEAFCKAHSKEIKNKYSSKLANSVQFLDEMGLLKKYNNQNNNVLDNMSLPMLKCEYESQRNKFGLTDLTNPEFVKRFSLEEIIAMTSFYSNRLEKEILNYNESMYIANKMGIIDEIYEKGECKLEVTDENLRELLAQLSFLMEIGNKVIQESYRKYNVYCGDNKVELDLSNNKVRRKLIELYGQDYNELYKNLFLKKYDSDFEEDLDIATILELDTLNLYSVKDFAMESLMVILTDKGKNMNWGYIPENKNGKNSIQNKEKFVLIGIDMKGFNMPIKLHFERERLEIFLENYTGDAKLPVYEGNDDMEVTWNGFITTQVYMPLTKEQRKDLKKVEMRKSDYRYRFLEHIKWMMLPNRYPEHLCDNQGNKMPRRYIDISTGRIDSSGDEPDL